MSEKEGTLRMMASGRWAVSRAGREPVEITSGDLYRIEVAGAKGAPRSASVGKNSDGVRFCSTFVVVLAPLQRYRSPRAQPQSRSLGAWSLLSAAASLRFNSTGIQLWATIDLP